MEQVFSFISNNPGCIRTQVIKHLDSLGLASKDTTSQIINSLIQDNTVHMKKDKPNSQTQHLYINKEDEFNIICSCILDVQKVVTDEKLKTIVQNFKNEMSAKGNHEKMEEIKNNYFNFNFTIEEIFMKIVFWLLITVNSSSVILDESKSKRIYSKLINLIKLMNMPVEVIRPENEVKKLQILMSEYEKNNGKFDPMCRDYFIKINSVIKEWFPIVIKDPY